MLSPRGNATKSKHNKILLKLLQNRLVGERTLLNQPFSIKQTKDWDNVEPFMTDCCPAPIVNAVHPETVTVAKKEPSLVQEVLGKGPMFFPEQKSTTAEVDRPLPGCGEVSWLLPHCINDRKRDYSDDWRRLQLKMKIPVSN